MKPSPLRIATRASQLALWQATFVAERLRAVASGRDVALVGVSTVGDRDRTQPLAAMGNTGVFTREVQRAVLDGRADVAVHSLKDLPTQPSKRLTLAAVPERASPFDALVLPNRRSEASDRRSETQSAIRNPQSAIETTHHSLLTTHDSLDALPNGARVGTGSPRRSAQLLHWRPDLKIGEIRGNVETRVRKLDDGEFDAVILAEAGLQRLDLGERISERLVPPLVFPAVGQGALGIECRNDDAETLRLLREIDHASTHAAVAAERRLMSTLGAGCHAPVGVETNIENDRLSLAAVVLSLDGTVRLFAEESGALAGATELGERVAEALMRQGAASYL